MGHTDLEHVSLMSVGGRVETSWKQDSYDTESPIRARRSSVNSGEMVEVNVTAVDATAILLW